MKQVVSLHDEDMSFVFQKWNACDELKAFLIEITSIILRKKDSKSRNRARRGARQEFVVDNVSLAICCAQSLNLIFCLYFFLY